MKTYLLIVGIVLFFCGHPQNDGKLRVTTQQNSPTIKNSSESFKINVYEDNDEYKNELLSSYLYKDALLQEVITYNTQTKKQECHTKFYYKENAQYDRFEVLKGSEPICEELKESAERSEGDYQVQIEFLHSKNIKIPFAPLSSEVSDLSKVLSIMDNYDGLKKETEINGNQKAIRFFGLNKRIRFYPSSITLFIDEQSLIKNYELILREGFPQKEFYKTENGEFTREYFYDDEQKIVKIVCKFTGEVYVYSHSETRFEYQKIHNTK